MIDETAHTIPLARPGTSNEGRLEILHCAAEIFTEKGFTLTTIDDIADRMVATKGRVYHYYRSKADIYLDVHQVAMELMLSRVAPLAEGDRAPSEKLFEMAAEHARLVIGGLKVQRAAIPATDLQVAAQSATQPQAVARVIALRDSYERVFADVINAGIAAGEFHGEASRLLTKFLLGTLNWITIWYREGVSDDPELIATECARFIVHGVRQAPPGA